MRFSGIPIHKFDTTRGENAEATDWQFSDSGAQASKEHGGDRIDIDGSIRDI